ncbi:MAG TPA: COQ9 family protein [Rhizomicrobium sp.]|nr:COQ9 family protein [Rhizomicrobium sp.]
MAARKKPADDSLKAAVLEHALEHAAFDGFTDATLAKAARAAGAGKSDLARLFPDGPRSLVEAYSRSADAEMRARLAGQKLAGLKVRERIARAVTARIAVLRPHKEAARRAAAFLTLPPNAVLATKLLYRTVDAIWRAAGDTSTDFNFYTKRAILAGVWTSTLMRWFTDDDPGEAATRAFLDARIENVMQFEKFKARVRERAKGLPSLSSVFGAFSGNSSAR